MNQQLHHETDNPLRNHPERSCTGFNALCKWGYFMSNEGTYFTPDWLCLYILIICTMAQIYTNCNYKLQTGIILPIRNTQLEIFYCWPLTLHKTVALTLERLHIYLSTKLILCHILNLTTKTWTRLTTTVHLWPQYGWSCFTEKAKMEMEVIMHILLYVHGTLSAT